MKNFNPIINRDYLMKRMGDPSQLAGTRRYELLEGRAKGVEAIDFRTGTGLFFTVLPGRGMDIAWAEYKGVPIGYISKTGVVSATSYDQEGLGWLRSFFGGLLTTCGLSNVGAPCEDNLPIIGDQSFGLHGRISNTISDNVCVKSEWQGNKFIIETEGRMRESIVHGENLTLTRHIQTNLGSNKLQIHDIVRNDGFQTAPLMILYHFNIGYPLLDTSSEFVIDSSNIVAADDLSKERIGQYDKISEPELGALENLYFHQIEPDSSGFSYAGVVNHELELGMSIRFRPSQLKNLIQWKQMGQGEYVLGIEPGNCLPIGRQAMMRQGGLEYILPDEARKFDLEVEILDGKDVISQFCRQHGRNGRKL
jgi:hypothetical protein